MQVLCRKGIGCLLALSLFTANVFAQAERAIVYPGQDVRLNGNQIQMSSAVMSGDKIQTGTSSAQLTGRGLLALIESNSALQYGDVMILECGGVSVSSSANGVQASDTRVTPAGNMAKFQIVNRGGKLTISVQSGAIRVSSDEISMLSAGQSIERASHDGCPVATAQKTPAAASGGRGKMIGLVIAGGGAGAAGIIIAGRDKKPVSASRP